MLAKLYNALFLRYYCASVGKNFSCIGRLIIQGHGDYHIGDNVYIISKETLNPIGGGRTVLQTLGNGCIRIGNNVGISHVVLCAMNKIEIGDDVLLGAGVKVYDNDFHSVEYLHRMEKPDTHIRSEAVNIKKGAFIGAHSIILKGVVIGEHSVIGAGSVVTKDVPDKEIWAGNPAKRVGFVKT